MLPEQCGPLETGEKDLSVQCLEASMVHEIKCVHCGTINVLPTEKCRVCGMPIESPEKGRMVCPNCGSEENLVGAHKCIDCGTILTSSPQPVEEMKPDDDKCEHTFEEPMHIERSARVYMAGVLIFIAGAMGVAHALLATLPGTQSDILSHYNSIIPAGKFLEDLLNNYAVIGGLMFLFGIAAVAMSTFAFNRTRYWGSIAGACFGFMSIGFLIGAFLALVAIVLLVSARQEFYPECR
jgi:DNA-directed RNA polymerase subunit RPC12/RpoP